MFVFCKKLAGALACLLPLLAQAQAPGLHAPAAYFPPDQARYQPGAPAPAPPAGLPAAGTHRLRPGVAVFGWLPAWVPLAYARQVDFTLLSHVAYDGYQATEAGALQAPATGDAGPLAELVHQANPRCRVLLSVAYHEPATGAALFGARGADERQALAQAVARQVSALEADGVHFDLTFRPQPAAAAAPHAASKSEQDATKKRLKKTRDDLNDRNKALVQTTKTLQHIRDDFAQRQKKNKPISPAELAQYTRVQQQQQADSTQFIAERTRFRAEEDALEKHMVLPVGPGADGRPAAVRELIAALRQALPQATLTLGLPATDAAGVYAGLLPLTPALDACVLQAFDYTAGRPGEPGPLAPVQPGATWGPQALATSVDYYLKQGVRPAQLLVGLASVGKVWTMYNPPSEMPAEGTPVHYWYLTSRSLAAWVPTARQPDAASGTPLLALPPPPAALLGTLLKAPYKAWADDSASLAARYDWVLSRGLGGVGIWALGFDAPDAPLWACVRARLAAPATPAAAAAVPATTVATDTTTTPVAATAPAPPPIATDSTGLNLQDVITNPGESAQQLARSEPARVLLLGLMLLLAGAWVGMLVGAVRTARYWVPFARRQAWMLALLLGVGALLAVYVSYVGPFTTGELWLFWLLVLGGAFVLWRAYRRSRPAYPLP